MEPYKTDTYISEHKVIPGNPSTAKSSNLKLNKRKKLTRLIHPTYVQLKAYLQHKPHARHVVDAYAWLSFSLKYDF